MKKNSLFLGIAFFTFLLGISVTLFGFSGVNDIENSATAQTLLKPEKSQTDWETFLSFENRDLRKITDEQNKTLISALNRITKDKGSLRDLKLISKVSDENNQKFYILIAINHLSTIPGNCGLRIHLFDEEGNHLNFLSFDAGWRMDLKNVKVRYSPEIEREIIEVESEPVINGRNIARQYYALIGTEILPIRLENDKQQAVPNFYESPNATIGLNLSGHSAAAWKNSLKSKDKAGLLASLLWLGGEHINPQRVPAYYNKIAYEDVKEATLIQKLKADKEIKLILQNLTKSENRWLKDAVNLVENNRVE